MSRSKVKATLLKTHVSYVKSLPHLAKCIYPDTNGLIKIKKNMRFCLWGLVNPKPIKILLNELSSPPFRELLTCRTDLLEKPLKPYVCVSWTSEQRTKHLIDHIHIMNAFWGPHFIDILTDRGHHLVQITDRHGAHYYLKLFAGEDREGALGLRLTDSEDQPIYSITFNLSQQNGTRILHIGALQGPNDNLINRQEIIKRLTKATHGIRTKALMVEFTLMLANQLQMDQLQGISNKGHIYQALRYIIGSKGKSVSFNYDQLWQEYGATPIDPYLYRIPLNPKRKNPEDLNKTKRRLYEKRYRWLAEAEQTFQSNMTSRAPEKKTEHV